MTDVQVRDFSTHTVRYLLDKKFMESLSEVGTMTTPRRDSDEQAVEIESEHYDSEPLFDSFPDWRPKNVQDKCEFTKEYEKSDERGEGKSG